MLALALPLLLLALVWQFWLAPDTAIRSSAAPPSLEAADRSIASAVSRPELARTTVPAAVTTSPAELLDALDLWMESWSQVLAKWPESTSGAGVEGHRAAADLLLAGQYEKALRSFDRLLVRSPNESQLLVGKALALTGLGRDEDAVPLLEHVAQTEPQNLPVKFSLGTALMRTGQQTAAAEAFQAILKADPGNLRAKWNLAVSLQAAGRVQEAIDLWRELTQAGERERGRRRDGEKERGRDGETERRTVRSQLTGDQLLDAWAHRGELAIGLHRSEEAEMCFHAVLEIDPAQPAAWCNIGVARADAGRREEALAALEKALQLDPRFLPALNQSALIQAAIFRDGDSPEAKRRCLGICEKSLAIDPQQPAIRSLRDTLDKIQPQPFGLKPGEITAPEQK